MQRIPRRQFTDDFKSQAVALVESVGPAKAARQLDISVKTLANWLTNARAGRIHPRDDLPGAGAGQCLCDRSVWRGRQQQY